MLLSTYDIEFRAICYQLRKIEENEIREQKIKEEFPEIAELAESTGYEIESCFQLFLVVGNDAARLIKEAKENNYLDCDLIEMSRLVDHVSYYGNIKMPKRNDFVKLGKKLNRLGKVEKLPRKLRNGWK